jgi:hypothetical protein
LPRALLALVAVLALVPVLSACGESEEEAFRKDYKPVNKRIVDLGEDVGKAVNGASGKTDEQIASEFGKLAQRTGEVSQQVDELDPPDDLAASQDDLVESLGDARDSLRDIEKAAGESDPQAARRATIQLITSSTDLRDARRKLERATR